MKKLLLTLFISLIAFSAQAFDPKAKPVQVVVTFTPGGGVDQTLKHVQKFAAQQGITMVPVYKPGAEGLIGMSELVTMPNDGYHVSITTAGVIAYYRMRNPSTDVQVITGIREGVMGIITNSKSNIKTLDGLIDALKEGRPLNIGYGAPTQHMFMHQLLEVSRAKKGSVLVPYKGTAPVINDLIAGHIDVAVVPVASSQGSIDNGKLTLLATSSKLEKYKVPEMNSKFPNWEAYEGFAFIVEKNTDPAAIKFWSEFFRQLLNDPQIKKDFVSESTTVLPFGPAKINRAINTSITRLDKMQ